MPFYVYVVLYSLYSLLTDLFTCRIRISYLRESSVPFSAPYSFNGLFSARAIRVYNTMRPSFPRGAILRYRWKGAARSTVAPNAPALVRAICVHSGYTITYQ